MASTRSRSNAKRVPYCAPWSSISSTFQPPPMPRMNRPPESASRLATDFAVTMGSRCGIRQMPVPSLSVSVAAAANDSDTNGSCVCEYSRGRSPPPGKGDLRLAGICVCSGTNSDSKPRASNSRASSSTRIA